MHIPINKDTLLCLTQPFKHLGILFYVNKYIILSGNVLLITLSKNNLLTDIQSLSRILSYFSSHNQLHFDEHICDFFTGWTHSAA